MHPYSRNHQVNSSTQYVLEYTLSIKPANLVNNVLKNMPNEVRWLPKIKTNPELCNSTKYCEFYSSHGHLTKDCRALRIEVLELLKKGLLAEYLTDKDHRTWNREKFTKKGATTLKQPIIE